jgi:hypothetical protein
MQDRDDTARRRTLRCGELRAVTNHLPLLLLVLVVVVVVVVAMVMGHK